MYHRLQLTTISYLQVNFTKTLTEILLKVALYIIKQTNIFISVYIGFSLKKTHTFLFYSAKSNSQIITSIRVNSLKMTISLGEITEKLSKSLIKLTLINRIEILLIVALNINNNP